MTAHRVIDADGHVNEPEGLWAERLPARYHRMAPGRTRDSQGRIRLIIAEKLQPFLPSLGMEQAQRPGGVDPLARLVDMDSEGMDVAVCFTSIGLFFGGVGRSRSQRRPLPRLQRLALRLRASGARPPRRRRDGSPTGRRAGDGGGGAGRPRPRLQGRDVAPQPHRGPRPRPSRPHALPLAHGRPRRAAGLARGNVAEPPPGGARPLRELPLPPHALPPPRAADGLHDPHLRRRAANGIPG